MDEMVRAAQPSLAADSPRNAYMQRR